MPYLIGTTLDSGRIPTKKAVTAPKPSTWMSIPTAPGMRTLPGSRPQPRMADEEDALGRRRYIDKVYAGLISPQPEVQRAVGEQYDYNKKRALAGKKPLEIADTRWNPAAYDDNTNEALEAWYKQHRSLPGPGEQSEFDYMSREFRNQKAVRERRDAAPASMSAARPADDERAREITQGWKDAMARRKEEDARPPLGGGLNQQAVNGTSDTNSWEPIAEFSEMGFLAPILNMMNRTSVASQPVTNALGLDTPEGQENFNKIYEPIKTFVGSSSDAMTLGALRLLARASDAARDKRGYTGPLPRQGEMFEELDQLREQHPAAAIAGDIAGSLMPGTAMERAAAGILAKTFPKLTNAMIKSAVAGGAAGGVQNALLNIGQGGDPLEVAKELLLGMALGSAGDVGVRVVSDLAGNLIPKIGSKLYDEWLKSGQLIKHLDETARKLGANLEALLRRKPRAATTLPTAPLTDVHAVQPMESLLPGKVTPELMGLDEALARRAGNLDEVAGGAGADYTGGNGRAVGEVLEDGATVLREGAEGVLKNANFAQTKFRPAFSKEGQQIYSELAGVPITTIDDLVNALKRGLIKTSDVPIDYIVRDGHVLILNTRSSHALIQAGIPRSQWNAINRTGIDMYESMLNDQLKNNKLTSAGTPTAKMTGGR